jgi:putative ABC transport system permease protein
MRPSHYILSSLRHYRFAYLGVLAGAVLGATILLGALFAGDSVAASLRRIGEQRIGRTTHVITAGDRFFRQALANDYSTATKARVAPLLYARGTAAIATGRSTLNQIQLVGVTNDFWRFAPTATSLSLDAAQTSVAVNDTLAHRLQVKVGDTLIVRLQKPGIVVGNAPVAGAEASLQSLRCTIAHILGDDAFGRFTLDATQVPQPSVFLPIDQLQQALERPGRSNVLLIEADPATSPATADLDRALRSAMTLSDYGLTLRWNETARMFEIVSDRIFIDPELANAFTAAVPDAQPVVSYLINQLKLRDHATPYSIGTATTPTAAPFLPADLGPKEIVLNQWIADDLQASTGDDVTLTFFQSGSGDLLVETSATFCVRSIVPLSGLAGDRTWMPEFPGISNVARPSDWDPGLPLDLTRIRPKDERYWDDHRGTPKAFLSLEAGRTLWSSRWGTYTALRIPDAKDREAELTTRLLQALRPAMNQLSLRNVRVAAGESAQSAVDFGGLFIGMSFFLILAALGLVAMLFQLSLLQRNREDALLGAVGISNRQLLRWRIGEGAIIAVIGAVVGLGLATLYTRGILLFLETIWAGQSASSTFAFAAKPASIGIGVGVFIVLSLFALWLAVRRMRRRALSIRLAAHTEDTTPPERIRRRSQLLALIAGVAGTGAIAISGRGMPPQGAFYLGGFLFLVAGIALCRSVLAGTGASAAHRPLDPVYLGALNLRTRRARSLTVVALIATAVFMVLSVASFRKQVGSDWLKRTSGTGGFAFWIETTAPQNLAREARAQGFEAFQRHAAELGEIVPLRAGIGDNVNCFNLNVSSQPKLLAVDAGKLAARLAFSPKVPGATDIASAWKTLRTPIASGAIPAVVDETTLMWALKRKVGDVLTYADENGREFRVQIVGTIPDSLFQGYVIIDEAAFLQRFPTHAGYSVFLVDARDTNGLDPLRTKLETALRDAGGRVELTRDVLASFHQIENTYIAIFNVLGSLGVVLGSLGLAIVVARNLRERRGEFAVMSAIGISRGVLARMVFAEFGRMVTWGIAIGAIASAVAVWPSITALPAAPTILLVVGLLAGIVALNLVCGWMIFRWSMRDLRPGVALAAT